MIAPSPTAFYDLDGTLISGNVVTRYAFLVRNHPSRLRAVLKYSKLLATVPLWIALDLYSRRRFNEVFYRQYRGLERQWLESMAERLFEQEVRPKIYPGAQALVEADRAAGYKLVLVTGALDFDLPPLVRHFGFDHVLSNRLVFAQGRATGEIAPPLLAGQEKQEALRRFCRDYNVDTAHSKAYSDSYSDLPLLESVGLPAAANPDRRLRRVAIERCWPVLDLRKANHGCLR
jgi:HAD superfamily hydrolase (TIGR01490 family)